MAFLEPGSGAGVPVKTSGMQQVERRSGVRVDVEDGGCEQGGYAEDWEEADVEKLDVCR